MTDSDYWKDWKLRDVFDKDPPRFAPTRSELAKILRAKILSYEESYALQCNGYRVRARRAGQTHEFTFDAFDGIGHSTDRSEDGIRRMVREWLCAKSAELWP